VKFYSSILLATLSFSGVALCDTKAPSSPAIDPDRGAYGVAFGSTEKQIVEKLGTPTGTVQLSSTRRALIYGKSHAFILRKGAFRTLIVVDSVLDYRLSQGMESHPVVDSISWTLGPGIKDGMSYAQVAKALGRAASLGDYNLAYETTNARVELQFAGMQGARGDPESFSLRGFVIDYEP
jgi:hypothetical protein